MKLVFLGPPGVGKGTQAKRIAEKRGLEHLSTGDILREAVKNRTPVGKKAEECMKRGDLVGDDVVIGIIEERLKQFAPDQGFVFDGFPRTIAQAQALDNLMWKLKSALNRAFYFEAADEVVVERLSGRRTCKKCGAVFHLKFSPPKKADVCDGCGGELYQRPDDNEKTVRDRLRVYKDQTAPLIKYYEDKRILLKIDGAASPEQVTSRIEKAIGK